MELSLNCRCPRITLGQGVTSVILPIWGYRSEVTRSCWHKNYFFFVSYVCVLHSLISKKIRHSQEVMLRCSDQVFLLLNNFLLTETCFHECRFVAVTYFSTIVLLAVFVLAWSLGQGWANFSHEGPHWKKF